MSGNDASTMQQELCNTQETMLGVSWTFTIAWVIMFIVWCIIIFATCRRPVAGRRASGPCPKCHPMQWLMLIVPFFLYWRGHLAGVDLYALHLHGLPAGLLVGHDGLEGLRVHIRARPAVGVAALPLLHLDRCRHHPPVSHYQKRRAPRYFVRGFITAMALGLPLTVVSLGIDSTAAFAWSLIMYAGILIVILSDAYSNSKVSLLRPWPLRCLGSLSGDGARIRDFPRSTRGADGPLLRMHISSLRDP